MSVQIPSTTLTLDEDKLSDELNEFENVLRQYCDLEVSNIGSLFTKDEAKFRSLENSFAWLYSCSRSKSSSSLIAKKHPNILALCLRFAASFGTLDVNSFKHPTELANLERQSDCSLFTESEKNETPASELWYKLFCLSLRSVNNVLVQQRQKKAASVSRVFINPCLVTCIVAHLDRLWKSANYVATSKLIKTLNVKSKQRFHLFFGNLETVLFLWYRVILLLCSVDRAIQVELFKTNFLGSCIKGLLVVKNSGLHVTQVDSAENDTQIEAADGNEITSLVKPAGEILKILFAFFIGVPECIDKMNSDFEKPPSCNISSYDATDENSVLKEPNFSWSMVPELLFDLCFLPVLGVDIQIPALQLLCLTKLQLAFLSKLKIEFFCNQLFLPLLRSYFSKSTDMPSTDKQMFCLEACTAATRFLARVASENPNNLRIFVRKVLAPLDINRNAPLRDGDALPHRLVAVLVSYGESELRDAVDELYAQIFENDYNAVSSYVGLGNAAGFLLRRKGSSLSALSSLIESRNSQDDVNSGGAATAEIRNPITGRVDELSSPASYPVGDMAKLENELTESEREERARELNELFDRMEALGITAMPANNQE